MVDNLFLKNQIFASSDVCSSESTHVTVIYFIVVGYLSGRALGPLTATGASHSHWGVLLVGTHTYNHYEARMHTIYRVYRHR